MKIYLNVLHGPNTMNVFKTAHFRQVIMMHSQRMNMSQMGIQLKPAVHTEPIQIQAVYMEVISVRPV